jgi:molybdate transport system ATP-binding protein
MSLVDARIVKHLAAIKGSPAFDLDAHLKADLGITVLVGPSGAGKTLILDCLAGFVRPDEGRILVRDQLYFDASANVHLPPERRRCGYIFQDHALFPHMTVRQNLRFAARLPGSGVGRLNVHRRINDLLQSFELGDLGERKPAQLSGGQRQRAALARILIREPGVLLLDEPSRGLDASLRQSFYHFLRATRERFETPIILVSHDISECLELADFITVISGGRLLQSGSRDAVFDRPANLEVAELLGVYNIVPAEVLALDPGAGSSRLRILGHEVEGPYLPGHLIGDNGYACLRRSELKLVQNHQPLSRQQLNLRLQELHPSPHGVQLSLEGGFSIIVREADFQNLPDKNRLTVEILPQAIAFLDR